jgi:archaellum component FlaD/FlaE
MCLQAKRQKNAFMLELLAGVREELDEVEEDFMEELTGMTAAERAEEEEKEDQKNMMFEYEEYNMETDDDDDDEEEKEDEETHENEENADVEAVVAAPKETLEPPRALPLRCKGDAANAHAFTKSLGRSSGKTLIAEWKASLANSGSAKCDEN